MQIRVVLEDGAVPATEAAQVAVQELAERVVQAVRELAVLGPAAAEQDPADGALDRAAVDRAAAAARWEVSSEVSLAARFRYRSKKLCRRFASLRDLVR
jgi:hypothetical protein